MDIYFIFLCDFNLQLEIHNLVIELKVFEIPSYTTCFIQFYVIVHTTENACFSTVLTLKYTKENFRPESTSPPTQLNEAIILLYCPSPISFSNEY